MKILNKGTIIYIGGFELPDKNAAAHRVLANAKAFRDLGHEVILVGVEKCNESNVDFFYVQGFKCYNIIYPTNFIEWIYYLLTIKNIKKILNNIKPNYIIAYNYPARPLFKLLQYSRSNNVKIFADVTEWYEAKGSLIYKVLKRLDVNFRMKYLHKNLDGLIVISDYLENFYKKSKVSNIINVPPLVDLSEKKWKNDVLDLDSDSVYNFIYSGSPGNGNKDRLDMIVENLKKFHLNNDVSIILNIVGINEVDYINTFNNKKKLNSDYSFVKFHGRISHFNSIELLKKADFSIFFRKNNLTNNAGFPTKFVESISSGTPVITNVSSSIARYFSEDTKYLGFLIDELDPTKIEEVFKQVFSTNKQTIKKYKKQCIESKLFDYSNFNERFEMLIDNVSIQSKQS